MRILLVDSTLYAPSSPLFLEALQELSVERGFEYSFVDEAPFLRPLSTSLIHKVVFRLLGRRPLTYWALNRKLLVEVRRFRPDLVIIVQGAYFSFNTLNLIKEETGKVLINYATDDPLHPNVSTRDLIKAIPIYDLYACTMRSILDPVSKAGCRMAIYVPFGYKPAIHYPEKPSSPDEKARFDADVAFVGTCDSARLPYLTAIIERIPDVRLAIYGGVAWKRYRILRRYYRGLALGREYRLALGGAKIVLAFSRRAHHPGPLMRHFEIPACAAFMLAERTEECMELLKEDQEAVYFGSPEELVDKVRYYLSRDDERQRIAEAGHRKVTLGGNTYKDRLIQILEAVRALSG